MPQADKEPLTSRTEELGVTPGEWFDISLYKMMNIYWGNPPEMLDRAGTEKMTSVSVPFILTVNLPEKLQKSGRKFYLLRCSDGEAELVAQSRGTTLSWESDVFSTYLIAYKDTSICPKDDTCPITPFTDTDKNEWYHDGSTGRCCESAGCYDTDEIHGNALGIVDRVLWMILRLLKVVDDRSLERSSQSDI